jgi:acyl-CoA synthetase (AMP-forming)/AMP-acid ligase II
MNFCTYLFENIRNTRKDCLISCEETLTYQDLLSRVNSLSAYLISNIGTGNECLILSENNPFFVIAYLAVIRSGNVALLVETQISDSQLAAIYQKCRIRLSFIQEKFFAKIDGGETILTDESLEKLPPCKTSPPHPVNDDDVAVVIFTSGSTGTKKGVMLTHKNLCANTSSIVEYLKLTPEDRICVTLPFFYCYGASLLHTHLRVGGSVVLSKNIFIGGVIRDINLFQCTGFAGVPSTYQILINKTPFLKESLPTLRYMQQAGGQLPNKYIKRIVEAFPKKEFFVMYGATEATARMSYLPPDRVLKKLGSLGRGIPGVTLDVINDLGMPVRPGEIGEIVASGNNIMKGYYGDPEGTTEVLDNGRLHTGDLATIDDEGYIFIQGRAKNIIKSGGYRISPNEIEDFICALEDITGCMVLGLPDETMGEAVVAVIQYEGHEPITEIRKIIEKRCRQQLPSYKIPQRLFFVRDFPLNASDKVDKPALSISIQDEIRKDPKAGL